MKSSDAIIIGGGIIGCAIARSLAKQGLSVLVLDKQQPGREASWAAAGMLSPQSETDVPDDFFRLCMASRDLYPAFAAEVSEESGLDVEYRNEGTIVLAFTEEQSQILERRAAWQQDEGLRIDVIGGDEVRKLLPSVSPHVR